MTPDEARTLSARIIDTWPNGPKAYIWANELRDLDPTRATRAFAAMRKEVDRPTLAAFHVHYAATRTATVDELDRPARCQLCDGTGWTDATPEQAHRSTTCRGTPGTTHGDGGCHCHAVTPCHCTHGAQARAILTLARTDHERER